MPAPASTIRRKDSPQSRLRLRRIDKLWGQSARRVSHLELVAGHCEFANFLADQYCSWVVVVVERLLLFAVQQDNRSTIKIDAVNQQIFAGANRACDQRE